MISNVLLCAVFPVGTTAFTAEAAKFLGIKVSYLHKLMMRRVIPYYKPNGKLCFFDKAELEAWMKNVRVASQAELDQQAQKYIINRPKR